MNPRNKDRFRYVGGKGGSTAFVQTHAMYACDLKGNVTEIVAFFDDLALMEGQRLRSALSAFQQNILGNQEFRAQIREAVAPLR